MSIILRKMADWLIKQDNYKTYTLEYLLHQPRNTGVHKPGSSTVFHDTSINKWRLKIQLDEEQVWFLSVFINENNTLDKFSLDKELASDSHYQFNAEGEIRKALYQKGDEKKYLHEILIKFVKQQGGDKLLTVIYPYITGQYHSDYYD